MKRPFFLLLALLAGAWCAAPARGAATFRPQGTAAPGSVPGGINYQGQLQENGIPVTARWGFVFRLYDSGTGGNLIATFPPAPDNMTINLISGMFSANIPVTTNTLVGGGQRWLEIEIDKEGVSPGSGLVLTPREQLVSMPYALVAKTIEGSIDISTGGLVITTAPASNAAFYISSGTAFIGIGTSHPATLLHMSSGTLTIDGPNGAGFHLSSGPMVIDGDLASLNVLGPAKFGGAGSQSSFNGAGALQLTSPLSLLYGGTGTNLSAAALGDIPYFSAAGVMSSLGIGGSNTILQTNGAGTLPAWTSASYPTSAAQGDLLYGSAVDTISRLPIGGAGVILRSSDTLSGRIPAWSLASYPDTVAKGDLLYGSAANTVDHLTIGAANTILQANGAGTPAWTTAKYPTSVALGDLFYGDAGGTVSKLAWLGTATRYLANTGGGSTIPAWDQVDLSNGVKSLLSISNGGTGANLSLGGKDARGSVVFFNGSNVMDTLAPGALGFVLTTNGTGADPAWKDLTTGATVYAAKNLLGGVQGSVPFQSDIGRTSMLNPVADGRLLMSQGPAADVTWTTAKYPLSTTHNQILYSNVDNNVTELPSQVNGVLVTDGTGTGIPAIGTNIPAAVTIGGKYIYRQGGTPVPFADGGTNANLSGLADGSLIYKAAGSLAGAALTGVIKGNGAGAPTALTGTPNYAAYWLDANTIAGVPYIAISSGGTGADFSGAGGIGGLIYKSNATTLANSGPLAGVLKGNGAGMPTALNGTPNYAVYWLDADTIAGIPYIAISSGGTGADFSGAAGIGGLIYKFDATTLANSGALTGVLKGTGAGAPTALTGTANYAAYWSDDYTVGSRQFIPVANGGTNADFSGAAGIGGLIYKFDATTLANSGALTGVLQGTGAGAPTALTGTAGYNAYWFDANTIKAEQYIGMSRGGTGADLSGAAGIGGLIYKFDATTLANTGPLAGVLQGTGAGAPTALTGTAGYNAYWFDANTIKAEQYTDMTRGGTGANLSGAPGIGGLIYKFDATTLANSGVLTGILKGTGGTAPTALTGTSNYNAYWSDANTIGSRQMIPIANGGTNVDLSGGTGIGGLIYKFDATTLANSGALTGILKGTGGTAPTALTGTLNYNAFWSDANTLGSRQVIPVANGGTNADLSGAANIGGLIYKSNATTLANSGALTGILKGTGGTAPTALTGTTGYNAFWSDANTIGSRLLVPVANGGTNADLSGGANIGGLIYKLDATTLANSGALTGILKGTGGTAPTALTGTTGYNAYWSNASTIGSRLLVPVANGGTNADLSGAADIGGLIYKSNATTLANSGALTGVLKGNGTGAPLGNATMDDIANGTYQRYNPASVNITGGKVSGTTLLGAYNRNKGFLQTYTPSAIGEIYFCTNCSPPKIVVSINTTMGAFADAVGGPFP